MNLLCSIGVGSVQYNVYDGPENPTWSDQLLHAPRAFYHFIQNLCDAFGYKFVFTVFAVYGLQQGNCYR